MRESALLRETRLAVLNAPFEADGWRRAVEMVARSCHASGANLVGFGGPLAPSLNMFVGPDHDRAEQTFARPELWGQCNWRVNSAGGPLSIQHEAHYAAYRGVAETADYDDAVSDLDMQFGCQAPLISDSRSFLGLALFRGRRAGRCSETTLTRFAGLIRDIHRAVRVQLALDGEAAELMIGNLDSLQSAMVLIDRYGCICAMTPAAEHLAEDGGAFRLCGLSFQLRNFPENRRMERAMRRLLALGAESTASPVFEMSVGRTASAPEGRWVARLVRLPRREHGLGFDPHLAVTFQAIQPAA